MDIEIKDIQKLISGYSEMRMQFLMSKNEYLASKTELLIATGIGNIQGYLSINFGY